MSMVQIPAITKGFLIIMAKPQDTAIILTRIYKNVKTTFNSLVPQLVPLNPATQVQLYESTPSVHVPPF